MSFYNQLFFVNVFLTSAGQWVIHSVGTRSEHDICISKAKDPESSSTNLVLLIRIRFYKFRLHPKFRNKMPLAGIQHVKSGQLYPFIFAFVFNFKIDLSGVYSTSSFNIL